MINYQELGLFILGFNNGLLFVATLTSSYSLVEQHGFNLGLFAFLEIFPGYLIQFIYPYICLKFQIYFNLSLVYLSVIIGSLLYYILPVNYLYISIVFFSINCYLGEIIWIDYVSELPIQNYKYWSSGTGLTGLITSGLYLILKLRIQEPYLIFIISYLILITLGFIATRRHPDPLWQNTLTNNQHIYNNLEISTDHYALESEINSSKVEDSTQFEEIKLDANDEIKLTKNLSTQRLIIWNYLNLFLESSSLWTEGFIRYFFNFGIIPYVLSDSNFSTRIYFISYFGVFLGKSLGNLYQIKNIHLYNLVHLYNVFLLIIINLFPLSPILIGIFILISNFLNGSCHPQVYKYIISNDSYPNKRRASTFVCQLNSLGAILAVIVSCLINSQTTEMKIPVGISTSHTQTTSL